VRLNKFLARAGVAARRRCDELIQKGEVSVNGLVVTEPWLDVNNEDDLVSAREMFLQDPVAFGIDPDRVSVH